MNKLTAITLFVAGLIVLGSSAMAANGDILTSKTTLALDAEELSHDPKTAYAVQDIDVDVALVMADLGVKPAKKTVFKAAPKQQECHFRGMQQGRLGEIVNVCE